MKTNDVFQEWFFILLLAGMCVLFGWVIGKAVSREPTLAPAYQAAENATWDRLEGVFVVDGDTIKADVLLGRDVVLRNQSIRLEGFDAWEISRRRRTVTVTDDEIAKGKLAAKALGELIQAAEVCFLTDGGRGVYGRCLGRLKLIQRDGFVIDVAETMIANGHDREGDHEWQ